jgi:hypothetical protein
MPANRTASKGGYIVYKLILGLLILVAVLTVACGDDDDDDGSADADTSPTASDEATEDGSSATDGGADSGGETFTSSQLPISVSVAPGEGFVAPEDGDLPDLFVVFQPEAPQGYVDFLQPTQVHHWASESESALGAPPDDYVAWFSELPYITIVDTQEVTVDSAPGTRLKITNGDEANFPLFQLSDGNDYDMEYTGNGAVVAYVIDVSGTQVLAICGTDSPNVFGEFEQTCDDIVSSAEFGT